MSLLEELRARKKKREEEEEKTSSLVRDLRQKKLLARLEELREEGVRPEEYLPEKTATGEFWEGPRGVGEQLSFAWDTIRNIPGSVAHNVAAPLRMASEGQRGYMDPIIDRFAEGGLKEAALTPPVIPMLSAVKEALGSPEAAETKLGKAVAPVERYGLEERSKFYTRQPHAGAALAGTALDVVADPVELTAAGMAGDIARAAKGIPKALPKALPKKGEDVLKTTEYVDDLLDLIPSGKPGLTTEPFGKDTAIVFRGVDGTPVGTATVRGDEVVDLGIRSDAPPMARGRAYQKIFSELEDRGVKKTSEHMSEEAQRALTAWEDLRGARPERRKFGKHRQALEDELYEGISKAVPKAQAGKVTKLKAQMSSLMPEDHARVTNKFQQVQEQIEAIRRDPELPEAWKNSTVDALKKESGLDIEDFLEKAHHPTGGQPVLLKRDPKTQRMMPYIIAGGAPDRPKPPVGVKQSSIQEQLFPQEPFAGTAGAKGVRQASTQKQLFPQEPFKGTGEPAGAPEAVQRKLVDAARSSRLQAMADSLGVSKEAVARTGTFRGGAAGLKKLDDEVEAVSKMGRDLIRAARQLELDRGNVGIRQAIQATAEKFVTRRAALLGGKHPEQAAKTIKISDDAVHLLARLDPDDPGEFGRMVQATTNPRIRDYLLEAWVSSVLSGPHTHLRNIIGNSTFGITDTMVSFAKPLAARVKGQPELYKYADTLAHLKGQFAGIREGIGTAVRAMVDGVDKAEDSFKFARRHAFANSPHKILRKLDPAVTLPLRALHSADAFFRKVGFTAKLYEGASQRARALAKKSGSYSDHMAKVLEDVPDDLFIEAAENGRRVTFTDEMSSFGNLISQTRNLPVLGEGFRYIFPFVQVADRLMVRGLEFTPASILMARGQDAARQIDLGVRGAIGAGVGLGLFLNLGPDDEGRPRIVGRFPKDAKARAAMYAQGMKEWSVRIGDHWIPFNQLEPVGTLLASVAVAHDAIREDDEGTALQVAERMFVGLGQQIQDKSYFQSVADVFEILRADGQGAMDKLERLGTRMMTGFVPLAGLRRQWASISDPYLRQDVRPGAEDPTLWDQVYTQQSPGKDVLLPRIDVWGDVIDKSQGTALPQAAAAFGTPLAATKYEPDPVYEKLSQLGVSPPGVGHHVTVGSEQVELTPHQYTLFRMMALRSAREDLEKAVSNEKFNRLPEDLQKKLLRKVARKHADRARDLTRMWVMAEKAPTSDAVKESRLQKISDMMRKVLGYETMADVPDVERPLFTMAR